MRVAAGIELREAERERLIRTAQSTSVSVRLAERAAIVVLAADGVDNVTIGEMLGVERVVVGRWRNRYAQGGFAAIVRDLPRGGRPDKIDAAELIRLTTQTLPEGATQWSTRSMAKTLGASNATVGSGANMGSSHTGSSSSKSPATRPLPRSSRPLSGST